MSPIEDRDRFCARQLADFYSEQIKEQISKARREDSEDSYRRAVDGITEAKAKFRENLRLAFSPQGSQSLGEIIYCVAERMVKSSSEEMSLVQENRRIADAYLTVALVFEAAREDEQDQESSWSVDAS